MNQNCMSDSELRDLTPGIYQLKQARSYTTEHLSSEGQHAILAHKDDVGILKAQIQSRHVSSKKYTLWLEYNQGLAPVRGWYCQCSVGSRVVGCCAHIASVLWYLGYHRHQP